MPPEHPEPSAAESSLTFIERFISSYYMRQPKWLRSVVFLSFVLLFIYSAIELIDGKHTLDTQIGVRLSQEELVANKILLPTGKVTIATKPAPAGYAVLFDEREYGANSHGWLRLDLSATEYAKVLALGHLGVKVLAPGAGTVDHEISFERSKLRLHPIILAPPAAGADMDPKSELGSLDLGWFVGVSTAFAAEPTLDRLFVRSITFGDEARELQGQDLQLVAGGQVSPLKTILSDKGIGNGGLPLFGKSSIYDYTYFFEVTPGPTTAKVIAKGGGSLFNALRDEEFSLTFSNYGEPLQTIGTHGSTLALQRMLPSDVVLFERLETVALSPQIASALNKMGFVVRVNSASSRIPGEYNALYSGREVSFQAVQRVLQQLETFGIRIKYLQHHLMLKSQTQNQIQIGSNIKFRCLDPLGNDTFKRLLDAKSEQDFAKAIEESRPKKVCGK
jgi:hypothetical protein